MINQESETGGQATVQVRPGMQHPTLGSIGGREGTVLRTFTAGGDTYVDIELMAKTIAGISPEERGRYYSNKIVFTHVRLSQKDVVSIPTPVIQRTRADAFATAQHEWYDEVGSHEDDPTKFVADRTAGGATNMDRRQMIRSLVGIGAFMVVLLAFMQRDCSCGTYGNGGELGTLGRVLLIT